MEIKVCNCCNALLGKNSKLRHVVGPDKKYYCEICVISLSSFFRDEKKVDLNEILTADKEVDQKVREGISMDSPTEIKAYLDEYVIGQEEAKKVLSVAAYNHFKRVKLNATSNSRIDKSNVLVMGPTGSGKTYILKTVAKKFGVPFAIADATTLTETGYVGSDVESVLSMLLSNADNDVERAKVGIVFIDEIDKLAEKQGQASGHTVNNVGVQQALLKLLEGSEVMVPVGGKNDEKVKIDTSDILFICGGAFPKLEDIIAKRVGRTGETRETLLAEVTDEDLKEFGLIPEFVGRLPIITTLENLSPEMFKKILTEPKNSIIEQYQRMFEFDGINLVFTDEALTAIAKKAAERQRGARALRTELENVLTQISYEKPGNFKGKIIITEEVVNGTGDPKEHPVEQRKGLGGLFR